MKGQKTELDEINSTLDEVTITEKEGVEHMFDQKQLIASLDKMVSTESLHHYGPLNGLSARHAFSGLFSSIQGSTPGIPVHRAT